MNKVNPNIFRAYDIRGLYPSKINKEAAFLIGRAVADFLELKQVIVGRDNRFSSKKLLKALIDGLLKQGVGVINLGIVSTPVLFSRSFKQSIDAGIMVTASHNPIGYNGFKIVRSNGEVIGKENGLMKILEIIKSNNFKKTAGKGILVLEKDAIKNYVKNIIKISPFVKNLKEFKVAIDAAHSPGGAIIKELFKYIKSKLYKLEFGQHLFLRHIPPFFLELASGIEATPNPLILETISDLSRKIIKKKCDIGFALDGDADRIIVLDEKGAFVLPDIIGALLAREILKERQEVKIAYEVRSSRVVEEIIRDRGGIPVKMPAGSTIMKKRIKEEKMAFGIEASGHYFFEETFYSESPALLILKILKIMSDEKKPFSEIIKSFQKYFKSPEINFKVKDKKKVFEEIKRHYQGAQISFIDGLTIEYPDWWFNLRKSNTEPLLRLNFEAKKEDVFKERLEEVKNLIANYLP